MPNPGRHLHAGDWLRRKRDPWELIKVSSVETDGNVTVTTLDDRHVNTTVNYLRNQFEKAQDNA